MSVEVKPLVEFICQELASITTRPLESFNEHTELVGGRAVVTSLGFVQLLLALEDYAAEELGCAFDWTSDSAMSEVRSHFRTIGTLASYLKRLANGQSAS